MRPPAGISSADPLQLKSFIETNRHAVSEDRDGAPVFLARSLWELKRITEQWSQLRFGTVKERA